MLWLEETFLGELEQWRIIGATKSEQEKKFLSHQTHSGLVLTTKAIVSLLRFLFKLFPKQYVLSKRLNQDPLETFFINIRRVGGTNKAPDIARYGQYQRLIACKKQLKQSRSANVVYVSN